MEILGLFDIPLWLILLLSFLLLLYVYGTWNHTVWSSQGIPGPKPWPLFGNTWEHTRESNFNVFTIWQKKYGRTVGCFSGIRPFIVVSDLDLIREIFIKQSSNFIDRFLIRGFRTKLMDKALFFAGGNSWRRIRNMMSPTFSTSKLKLMSHFIKRCTDLLVTNIENKARADQLIDVKEVFGSFTMDVIAGTGFGLETNSQTQEGEPFVQQCKILFKGAGFRGLKRVVFCFANAFPFLVPLMRGTGFGANSRFFFEALEKMVDDRRLENKSEGKKTADLLQMLVDAEADPELITDVADNNESKSNRRMTKEEILAQGFIVLVAGYETTATTLQYMAYLMALNPHVQDKVFEEIQDKLGDVEPTYDVISQLKYLEACIHETLRMFPPVGAIDRQALQPMTVRGIHIPADCGVILPIYTILHDPEYFSDPEVFNPDRYLEENMAKIHPVTVELPFGYGPRKCVGMRLAMLEIKLAAVKMFRRIRFVKCAETPEEIKLGKGLGLAVPDVTILVKAEIRSA